MQNYKIHLCELIKQAIKEIAFLKTKEDHKSFRAIEVDCKIKVRKEIIDFLELKIVDLKGLEKNE